MPSSPEELLEHTRMAMYQDRIFAFTPKGELIQLPKSATPIDFAYAVHSNLGDQAVGAKINGRVVPLRTEIEQGDQVQILRSKAQEPQANWLNFAITGKARAAIRRHIRHKEREETIALGHKLYDEIVLRLPTPPGDGAIRDALKRLKLQDEASLMEAIARRKFTDFQVMEALMPGSTEGEDEHDLPPSSTRSRSRGSPRAWRSTSRSIAAWCRATASSASAAPASRSKSTASTRPEPRRHDRGGLGRPHLGRQGGGRHRPDRDHAEERARRARRGRHADRPAQGQHPRPAHGQSRHHFPHQHDGPGSAQRRAPDAPAGALRAADAVSSAERA